MFSQCKKIVQKRYLYLKILNTSISRQSIYIERTYSFVPVLRVLVEASPTLTVSGLDFLAAIR